MLLIERIDLFSVKPVVIKVFKCFRLLQRKTAHFQECCNDSLPLAFSKMFQKGIDGLYLTVIILMVKYKLRQLLSFKIQAQIGGVAADLFIQGFIHTAPPPQS